MGRQPVPGSQKYIEKFGINSSGDPEKDVPIKKNNNKNMVAKNITDKAKKTLKKKKSAKNNKKEAPVGINIIGDSKEVMPSTSNHQSSKINNKRKHSNDDEDDEDYEIDSNVCKI
jgi:hypothetical protein